MDKWAEKAVQSAVSGATVVMLVAARTDSRWWQGLAKAASEIRFVDRRLHFGGSDTPAPFSACIVVLRPEPLSWACDIPNQTFIMTGYRKGVPTGWHTMTAKVEG
jgi:site-specific DNA-methyltransferase (adenine-specific)